MILRAVESWDGGGTIPNQRHLFDLPEDVAYFRCAAASPLLRDALAAGQSGLAKKARPWLLGAEESRRQPEQVRTRVAALIEAEPDDIALVPSASYGLSTAAANLTIGPGRSVVLLDRQFPSNVYPWQAAVQRDGGFLTTVWQPPKGDWTAAVLDAIGPNTAVVAVPGFHWTDGSRLDLEAVAVACRSHGAALVLDLSQSLGAVPFSVRQVDPDFMVAVAEKWMMGPAQLAYLYVAPRHQDGVPIEYGWANRAGSDDHANLDRYTDAYQPGARRFDAGERSNYATLPVAIRALDQILTWTPEAITRTLAPVVRDIARGAGTMGLAPTPPSARAPHMVGLRVTGGLEPDLAGRLAERGVHVSVRGDVVRVAPHVYNHDGDIDRLFDALRAEL